MSRQPKLFRTLWYEGQLHIIISSCSTHVPTFQFPSGPQCLLLRGRVTRWHRGHWKATSHRLPPARVSMLKKAATLSSMPEALERAASHSGLNLRYIHVNGWLTHNILNVIPLLPLEQLCTVGPLQRNNLVSTNSVLTERASQLGSTKKFSHTSD